MNTLEKFQVLKNNLAKLDGLIIAFSGGVDSTFLLKVAHDVLGNKVTAITAKSSTYPEREYNEAFSFAKTNNIQHKVIVSEELDIDGFSENPKNRCYVCKFELFSKIQSVSKELNIVTIADGSNIDDLSDYRPGFKALQELGIISPLKEAGLTKKDIRILSKDMSLPTWNKPAFACLSSRFPYGNKITLEKLKMVEEAEQFLLDMNFKQVRVRHHETLARIEVGEDELSKFYDKSLNDEIHAKLKSIGFNYVCLDLKGYRTGSMNEVIL